MSAGLIIDLRHTKKRKDMMTNDILCGVGKKMRSAYTAGKISDQEIYLCYWKNKAEADSFDPYGWTVRELREESRATHNPVLRMKNTQSLFQRWQKMHESLRHPSISFYKV